MLEYEDLDLASFWLLPGISLALSASAFGEGGAGGVGSDGNALAGVLDCVLAFGYRLASLLK